MEFCGEITKPPFNFWQAWFIYFGEPSNQPNYTMTKILNRILRRLARPIAAELGLNQEGRLDNEVVAQKTLMQQYLP